MASTENGGKEKELTDEHTVELPSQIVLKSITENIYYPGFVVKLI